MGVTVIVPLEAPLQTVAVEAVLARSGGPDETSALIDRVQPTISLITTVCVPKETPVKIYGLEPV